MTFWDALEQNNRRIEAMMARFWRLFFRNGA